MFTILVDSGFFIFETIFLIFNALMLSLCLAGFGGAGNVEL